MPRPLLATALLGCTLLACGQRGGRWQRFDLTAHPPEVLQRGRWTKPFRVGVGFLGEAEVRDMSVVTPRQLVQFPQRTSGQVRILEQTANTRLAWSLRLGREPLFSVTPIGSDGAAEYRVLIRDTAGEATEVFRQVARPPAASAPATIEIGLGRWAEQSVQLILEITAVGERAAGAAPPRATWGSPELWSRGASTDTAPDRGRPNVILLGLDTLRADAVGPRPGGRPSLTPALDALASSSDVWSSAYSTFNVTNPSFASIHTGLYGKNHGVYDLATPLPQGFTTLAECYAAAGYRTLAVISASHLGDHNSGLGQGFERVVRAEHHFAAEMAITEATDWIAKTDAGAARPFFAWVHLFDPHTPHTPPEPFALGLRPSWSPGIAAVSHWLPFREPGARSFDEKVLAGHSELYEGEVAYLDRQVGRLLDILDSLGLRDNTLIAVVADHGENLGEHGIRYRHTGLFETTTHVPLMIRWPGARRRGQRFAGLVQTIDLFPTLLAATGLPVPNQDGVDLRELSGPGRAGRRVVFAEHAEQLGIRLRTPQFSFMTSAGNGLVADGDWLFDLSADPGETRNLHDQGLPIETELQQLRANWLRDRRSQAGPATAREQSAEERAKLRALGYF